MSLQPTVRAPRNPALREHAKERRAKLENRLADTVTRFAGSMDFVYLSIVWYGLWIAIPLEEYPFGLLTMIVARGDLPVYLHPDQPEPGGREATGRRRPSMGDRRGARSPDRSTNVDRDRDAAADPRHPRANHVPGWRRIVVRGIRYTSTVRRRALAPASIRTWRAASSTGSTVNENTRTATGVHASFYDSCREGSHGAGGPAGVRICWWTLEDLNL